MNEHSKLSQFVENISYLFNHSNDLIVIKDLAFDYQACTRGFCDFFHMREKEVIGRCDYDPPWDTFANLYREQDKKAMIGGRLNTLEPIVIVV